MKNSEVLFGAADMIEDGPWYSGHPGIPKAQCAFSAMVEVAGYGEAQEPATIFSYFLGLDGTPSTIFEWNDSQQDKSFVVKELRICAEKEEINELSY